MNIFNFQKELDKLYNERLCSQYPRVTKDDLLSHGVIIYGGHDWGKLVISQLALHGIKPLWIIDANHELVGKRYLEFEIRPISSLNDALDNYILICSTHIKDMAHICNYYNVKKWIVPAALRDWCYITCEFGICMDGERYVDKLINAYSLMMDEKSRNIFFAFVRWHHIYENDFTELCDPESYFPNDLIDKIDYSFFIDAGAYTGDTLIDWIKFFKPEGKKCKYFAIEPQPTFFNLIENTLKTLPELIKINIKLLNISVGSFNGFVEIEGLGGGSFIKKASKGIHCKLIDDIFSSEFPTIIKADIEGSELSMLEGAEQTIRRCRPVLAISVYHKYSDLWDIPIWIHNLNLNYAIYLRHHQKRFTDTVCYAIPMS